MGKYGAENRTETEGGEVLTFGSLFAGIGGIDLGLERAGMVCKWQVEIDDYANKVLEKHWPNVKRYRDVHEVGRHNLERVDLLAGGFPCQDISYAGRGAGLAGERSGLFFEVVRLVRELRPRYVLLENVAALLSRGLDRVCGELAQIGYDTEWHCIPAAAVGAPHIRDRVFIFAHRNSKPVCAVDAEMAIMPSRDVAVGNIARLEIRQEQERLRQFASTVGVGQWANEPDVGRVAHGVPARVDRLTCLGNAIVPQVAEYVGRMILSREDATG